MYISLMLMVTLRAGGSYVLEPSATTCTKPALADVKPLQERASDSLKRGDASTAAMLWQRAAGLYPACAAANVRRGEIVTAALNALRAREATGSPSACGSAPLQAALLIRQVLAELRLLPERSKGEPELHATLKVRLAKLPEPTRAVAAFMDAGAPAMSMTAGTEAFASGFASLGDCSALRAAFVRHVLAALPRETAAAPRCDRAAEEARVILHEAMTTLERIAGASVKETVEFALLQGTLEGIDAHGPTLTKLRVRATAAREPDRAAEAWAELARGLPSCSTFLAAKQEATLAAVTAWQQEGMHGASARQRYWLADGLLGEVLTSIEAEPAAESSTLAVLREARASLVRPLATKRPLAVPERAPARAATPERRRAVDTAAPRARPMRAAGIAGLAIGASGWAMTIGGVVMGLGARDDLRALRVEDPTRSADALRDSSAFKHGETSSRLVVAGITIGVVGVAAGIILMSVDAAEHRKIRRHLRPVAGGLAIAF